MSDLPLDYARCYDPGCPKWQSKECARAEEQGNDVAISWLRPRRKQGGKDCEMCIELPGKKAAGNGGDRL